MAKQTFSVGQTLTAAQMTSLQQTAMLGGAASAKTASYTLVAADAGSAISMSNASATTITVNTALFAAGDTVQITNLGAGVCTITAGTATVNTSASLALAQYESGTLDFTSTSAAIFIKGAGAAATSGGMTLISTTTLTGSQIDLTSIPQTYINLKMVVRNFKPANDGAILELIFQDYNATNRQRLNTNWTNADNLAMDDYRSRISSGQDNTVADLSLITIDFPDYTNTTTAKMGYSIATTNYDANTANFNVRYQTLFYNQTTAITKLTLFPSSGNFTSGTVLLYGVK